MAELHEENPENILNIIMRMPDVVQTDKFLIEEHEWEVVKAGIVTAVDLVNEFRINEGKTLENEFISVSD